MQLLDFLEAAAASPEFKDAALRFARTGRPNERISFPPHAPAVKVERTLTKILDVHRDLPIESVEISGSSGCSSFRGSAGIRSADDEVQVEFDWDCRWKALQLGWTDYFGFPDQTRAAREFGYDCFRAWIPSKDPQPA